MKCVCKLVISNHANRQLGLYTVQVAENENQMFTDLLIPINVIYNELYACHSVVWHLVMCVLCVCAGIVVGENKKQLHLSLSYQYQDENHEVLLKKAKEMNLSAAARWDVRLYSRDPRVGQSEVRNCMFHLL